MPGLLENSGQLLANPLTHIGLGLLANSGPSRSPTQPMRGVMQGLLSHRAYRQQQQAEAAAQQQWEMEKAKYAMQLQKAQREQDIYLQQQQQIQATRRWIAQQPPEMQPKLLAMSPEQIQTQMAQQHFASTKGTGIMQNAEALGLERGTPEYNKFIREAVMKPDTVVHTGQLAEEAQARAGGGVQGRVKAVKAEAMPKLDTSERELTAAADSVAKNPMDAGARNAYSAALNSYASALAQLRFPGEAVTADVVRGITDALPGALELAALLKLGQDPLSEALRSNRAVVGGNPLPSDDGGAGAGDERSIDDLVNEYAD